MKKVIPTIMIALVIFTAIVIWGSWKSLLTGSHSTSSSSEKLIPISTTEWTWVKTDGRKFLNKYIIINGVTLKYYVAINNTNNPIELPSEKEVKYGSEKEINIVYFSLKPGQGVDSALVPFSFLE